jgi:hypothetical protein
MKALLFLSMFILMASCSKSSAKTPPKPTTPIPSVTLYCGHIHYGCEDVETDTVEIEIKGTDKVQIIRQFHRSDLPFTSAFVGKFVKPEEINAKFDLGLTHKNSRYDQTTNAEGEIVLTLTCADLKIFKDCKVSGHPAASNKKLSKIPGWDKTEGDVDQLACNLKAFTTDQASVKDCTDE